MEFEEKIIESLNRYLKYCAVGDVRFEKNGRELLIRSFVAEFEERELNDNFLILSLFENRLKEIEDKETRGKLLLFDYLVNRGNAFIVRIDWNSDNPIANLLEQVSTTKYKNINKKIKLIILG